jgi:quinoprotein glucose dehydrogenase/quinate dehydrogenase (quinone)
MGQDADAATRGRGGLFARPGAKLIGLLLGLIGLWLTGGGAWLLWLGGSPYYVLAGVGCLVSAWLYFRGSSRAICAYLIVFVATCIWGLAEVGANVWLLMPRVGGPLVIAVLVVLHRLWTRSGRGPAIGATVVALALGTVAIVAMRQLPALPLATAQAAPQLAAGTEDDWSAYGRNPSGSRYSPAAQITPANVAGLQPAWTYHTGDLPGAPGRAHVFEATPLKIGDLLYVCTSINVVTALDPDSGKPVWQFDPKVSLKGIGMPACRGVSHYQAPAGTADCPSRIIFATVEGRLIALDALTGKRCASFGSNGESSLAAGMGDYPSGYLYFNSPPTIVNDTIVLGGAVRDGKETGEPAGVIRGYDALTGKLRWAWDPGAANENPGPDIGYTRGSPNSWSVMSADPALNLVFVPLGNATPDYVDGHRTPEANRYSSSVVALDAATGRRRWSYQTVHNDVWDYDIGSQPVLFDLPMPGGGSVPALAQPTKQGDIYILDRRTGKPLTAVVERPVPQGSVPGERYSPTQPFSTGFPTLSPPPLTEASMWGATPLDQLWCRIRFRSLDYRGKYTPPAFKGNLQYPSNFGIVDWGSLSIDEGRRLMLVNSSNLAVSIRIIPRAEADRDAASLKKQLEYMPQTGTPYAALPQQFLSPLGLPCLAPPWGKLTAIDLATCKILWQTPLGTSRDQAPLGIAVPGGFNLGGSVATRGGVLFIAATIDRYLRAFDPRTGRELWRGRLEGGGQATPMTFVSRKTGRQYVVIAAGGHQFMHTDLGDALQAFALPVKR